MVRCGVILFLIFFSGLLRSQTQADSTLATLDTTEEVFKPKYRHGVHYRFKMRNGDVYSGYVKEETKDFVKIENRMTHETVELRKSEITVRNQPRTRDVISDEMGENDHARNYMLMNSALLFEESKASTNSHWLILENLEYSFTENWAANINTLAFYPFSLGVKCAYQVGDNNYIGGNAFVVGDIFSGSSSSLLFGYGGQARITRGTSNRNFTFSGGLLGLKSELFYTSSPAPYVNMAFVSAAYCNRLSKNVALNFEGWYLPDLSVGLAGAGVKFVGDPNYCWTVGCFALLNGYDNTVKLNFRTLPIPYFGVSRKFN
ncbi:hypothetical protein CNR22_15050 [Sphingobacteriaceae bacterium]|nr:hypothetical protein CNR22_15050 [Sphingobacteriaceae bacterium]